MPGNYYEQTLSIALYMFLVIDMRFIFFHIVSLIYNQLKKFNNPYGEKYSFCGFFQKIIQFYLIYNKYQRRKAFDNYCNVLNLIKKNSVKRNLKVTEHTISGERGEILVNKPQSCWMSIFTPTSVIHTLVRRPKRNSLGSVESPCHRSVQSLDPHHMSEVSIDPPHSSEQNILVDPPHKSI